MLLLPPVTLGALVLAYAAWAGVSPADPDAEATIRDGLPVILGVNHLVLFGRYERRSRRRLIST